jgi:glycosyltransferase involved in cell wall biosynthesis
VKISIITACFNSAATIRDTIESVLSQDYAEIEYIIIDGGSSDKTLEIVNEYKSRISKIISEKDEGIYFALNKGISLATGAVIGILHADDLYTGNFVISTVMEKIREADAVYSDLQYVDRDITTTIKRQWKSGEYRPGMFRKGWMPPHPTFFLRKEIYDQYGVFNTTFRTAADYELMLRMIHKHQIKLAYIPFVLVKMRVGGVSNKSLKNRLKANREDKRAWLINGLKPGMFTMIRKPLSKLGQYFG